MRDKERRVVKGEWSTCLWQALVENSAASAHPMTVWPYTYALNTYPGWKITLGIKRIQEPYGEDPAALRLDGPVGFLHQQVAGPVLRLLLT